MAAREEPAKTEGDDVKMETDAETTLPIFGCSDDDDDPNEPFVELTPTEIKQYILKKVEEHMKGPVNPLYALREKARKLEQRGKEQVEEYNKLYKGLQFLQRKQESFLRHQGVLPKITMCHASVSADLPTEPIPAQPVFNKELSITKVITSDQAAASSSQATPAAASRAADIECIDLTDDTESSTLRHPAPLPPRPSSSIVSNGTKRTTPPKPRLKISAEDKGIVLQWDMPPRSIYDPISTFEIFGYQEQENTVISSQLWKKIGGVKGMTLPMACTLTQFVDGNKYHFAIRAVDVHGQCGHFSDAISVIYKQKNPAKK